MIENDGGRASAPRPASENAGSGDVRKLMELSRSLAKSGDTQQALKLVDDAIEINPKNAKFHQHRSKVLSRLGDVQGAIAAARTATGLAPENPDVKAYLAGLLHKKGALAPALKMIDQAIALNQTDASFHRQRLELLEALGNIAEAIVAAKAIIALAPEDAQSKLMLAQLMLRSEDATDTNTLPAATPAAVPESAALQSSTQLGESPEEQEESKEKVVPENVPTVEEVPAQRSEATKLLEEIKKPMDRARPAQELSARKLPIGSRQDLDSLPQLSAPRLSPINPFPPRPQNGRDGDRDTHRRGFFARLFRWFS